MSESTRQLLCSLVDQGFTASIGKSYTMSALLRWGEESTETVVKDEIGNFDVVNKIFPELKSQNWYVFEIGRNCGTVFSADVVDSITIKDRHCIIHLKG